MIEVKKLSKVFKTPAGDFAALKSLSFSVPSGQFLAIVGRSGSGKSTLLYQMSLLDRPTEGSILIDKNETTWMPSNERTLFRLNNLGYVFQDYALIPTLTALENVAVPLIMKGLKMKTSFAMAEEALESVGLRDKAGNVPARLSGGQQQRVSIARGIVTKPKILFADEPTANLDLESSEQVLEVFEKLNGAGLTIIMVTHEEEYSRRADRVITLSDGKIIEDRKTKVKLN